MKKSCLLCGFVFLLSLQLLAQQSLLQSGPMVGYSEIKEALIWVQTKKSAKVQIDYWAVDQPEKIYTSRAKITTDKTAYTAKLLATELEPGQTYNYRLKINDEAISFDYPLAFQSQKLWQWREDPPNFKLAVGSCLYINETKYDRPGKPYGSHYQILESIHQQQPDLMLWLGDNTYLREADWYTKTGILHRYTHSRSTPEMQALLASTHHYAIWDDHDFGPNDSDRSFIHKDKALDAFQLFWGNPTFGLPDQKGITTFFSGAISISFYWTIVTTEPPIEEKTEEHTLLGKAQLEWLIDALTFSRAPFKMVAIGGQVLSNAVTSENYIRMAPEERTYLLKRIAEEKIKGVIFLDGDRHKTELSVLKNGEHMLYDLTVSPLTSGVSSGRKETNDHRLEGTLVEQHNFGILEFSGPRKERKMTIRIHDADGKEVWTKEITQADL